MNAGLYVIIVASKRGKVVSYLRTFLSSRPSRVRLLQSGILRYFFKYLKEHLKWYNKIFYNSFHFAWLLKYFDLEHHVVLHHIFDQINWRFGEIKILEAKPGFIINCVNVLWLKIFIYYLYNVYTINKG